MRVVVPPLPHTFSWRGAEQGLRINVPVASPDRSLFQLVLLSGFDGPQFIILFNSLQFIILMYMTFQRNEKKIMLDKLETLFQRQNNARYRISAAYVKWFYGIHGCVHLWP
jgi:hypothetical protein